MLARRSPVVDTARVMRPLILAALLSLSGLAVAEGTQWYTVELVVFEHTGDAALASEHWPEVLGQPVIEGSIELSDPLTLPDTGDDDPAGNTSNLPYAYRLLALEERSLDPLVSRLRRNRRYRPLLHRAWRQPGLDKKSAPTIHLHADLQSSTSGDVGADNSSADALPATNQADGRFPFPENLQVFTPADSPWVDGSLRVYRERYLHAEADLLYYRPRPQTVDASAGVPEAQVSALFRLQESRRMRSGELHFLDHPLFGVLIKTDRFEIPETPVEDDTKKADEPAVDAAPAKSASSAAGEKAPAKPKAN